MLPHCTLLYCYKYTACVLLLTIIAICDSYEGTSRWGRYQSGYRSPGAGGYTYSPGRYNNYRKYQTSSGNRWNNYVKRAYSSDQGRYGNYQYQYTRRNNWSGYQKRAPGQYGSYYTQRPVYSNYNRDGSNTAGRSSWNNYRRGSAARKDYASDDSPVIIEAKESVKKFDKVPIFYDRDTIMDVFDAERVSFESKVAEMMANYEHICLAKPDVPTPPPGKRKPFIVIEGNHGPSRKILAERLAERLGGRMMNMTRRCLEPFVDTFPKGSKLRRAFFGLALYASEYKVRQLWDKSLAVVMNGYWWDQSSYVLAWLFGSRNLNLPEAGTRIYNWPVDLMEPDILFYLKVPDKGAPSPTAKWMSLIPEVYQRIKKPKVVFIVPKEGINKTAEAMHNYINKFLKDTCDLSCTTPPTDSVQNDFGGFF